MKQNNCLRALNILCILLLFSACKKSTIEANDDTANIVQYSAFLKIYDQGDGTKRVNIVNPWDTTQLLARYYLVDSKLLNDKSISDISVPSGYIPIRVPISSAIVYSSVHTSPLQEMGSTDVIKGVADAEFFMNSSLKEKIELGDIVDIGQSISPSIEKIADIRPDVLIVSPYKNSGHGIIENMGISIIEMADYMEATPLGRAEWILLLGALTGKDKEVTMLFQDIVHKYNQIKDATSTAKHRPLILCDMPYNGVWCQPGGASYMSVLIRDAGGIPILNDDAHTGSVQMDIANVFEEGHDADIWIIKHFNDLKIDGVLREVPLADRMKPYKTGNIWFSNTSKVSFFDDLAFHPEKILADYAKIFHPAKPMIDESAYFTRL